MEAQGWFGALIHLVWKSPMWMRGSGPCTFALAPHVASHLSRFWGRSWTLVASHGFPIWHWWNKDVMPSHTHFFHPIFHMNYTFNWDSHVDRKMDDVMTCQVVHPLQLWDLKSRGILECWIGGLWCGGTKSINNLPTNYIAIIINTFNLEKWGYFVTPTQSTIDHKKMGTRYWSNNYMKWNVRSATTIAKLN
jgi:hypothetical protein